MARVTALRPRRGDRVAVELDGRDWRVVPADAVVRAGLATGLELDRARLRLFRRELRRSEALGVAVRALRHSDLSTARLGERLARAGVPPPAVEEALRTLGDAGLVDDERFATAAAWAFATRGWGDAAIRYRLEQAGVEADVAAAAVTALDAERDRAAGIVSRRGRSVASTRYLARRGFCEETIESVVGDLLAEAPGSG